jgi:hypothetical protein
MTALARAILSLEWVLHKSYNRKNSLENKLVVGLKGLGSETN